MTSKIAIPGTTIPKRNGKITAKAKTEEKGQAGRKRKRLVVLEPDVSYHE